MLPFYLVLVSVGFSFLQATTEGEFVDQTLHSHTLAFPNLDKLNLITSENLELSKRVLSAPKKNVTRRRRFLSLSSTFQLTAAVSLPGQFILGVPTSSLYFQTSLSFSVPTNLQLPGWTWSWGRKASGYNRTYIFDQIERLYEGFGTDGRACLLRTICEIAEHPFDHGLIGEIINYILAITTSPYEINSSSMVTPNVYKKARELGERHGECWSAYPRCPLSFANFFTGIHPF